jgi:hypothetical protein
MMAQGPCARRLVLRSSNEAAEQAGRPAGEGVVNEDEIQMEDDQLIIKEHSLGMTGEEMNEMVREIYDKTDRDMAEKEAQLDHIQARLDSLTRLVESLVVNPDIPINPVGKP